MQYLPKGKGIQLQFRSQKNVSLIWLLKINTISSQNVEGGKGIITACAKVRAVKLPSE